MVDAAPSTYRSSLRLPALLILGAILAQTAWILTLPPYRGTDEFDHAYRAASVAHGDWAAPRNGRSLVVVPRSIVEAAHPVCASYDYTGPENCSPVRDLSDGYVEVASRAATYNPLFYFVVGTAAKSFEGNASLYAMRIAAGLMCTSFLALASWVTGLWARTHWPLAAMFIAMTPVASFSFSVVAPNGIEMAAALSLWMSMMGLATRIGREQHPRQLLVAATVSAIVVATVRSLGPLWVVLIVSSIAVLVGARWAIGLVRENTRLVATCTGAVSLSAIGGVWWTRTAGTQTLAPSAVGHTDFPTSAPEQVPLWFLQGIAAFPRRSDPAPLLVYVLVGLVLVATLALGLVVARLRVRLVVLTVLVAAVAGPCVFTVLTIRYSGPLWQGRYGFPFHAGVTLLCGLALDHTRRRPSRYGAMAATLVVAAMLATANVISAVHVLQGEQRTSPLRDSAAWVSAPVWVVGALVVAGWAAWTCAAWPYPCVDRAGKASTP